MKAYMTIPQATQKRGRKTLHLDQKCPQLRDFESVEVNPSEHTYAPCNYCHPTKTQILSRKYMGRKRGRI